MTNIESDHYYLYDDEAVVIYHNSDSTCGGTFMEHHFPYQHIAKLLKENDELSDEKLMDLLFCDAFNCPTYCSDIGTDAYESILEKEDDGIMLEHPATLLKQCVEVWMIKEKEKQKDKADPLAEAVKIVNLAIDNKRKQLEAIRQEEDPDPILLEGETSAGYLVQLMIDPKDVIGICLNYDFCTFSILEDDFPDDMWDALARVTGLESVFSIDL